MYEGESVGENNTSIKTKRHIATVMFADISGFTAMGDAVNLASRLEGVSQARQILVGPATYKATKAGFKYKTLQSIALKGKAEPVPVNELLSVKKTLYRVQPGADRMISSAKEMISLPLYLSIFILYITV